MNRRDTFAAVLLPLVMLCMAGCTHPGRGGGPSVAEDLDAAGKRLPAREAQGEGVRPGSSAQLYDAAGHNDVALVGSLVSKGADVNATNPVGRTPLHLATEPGCAGVADLLITKGARVNAKDDNGATPLHYAANNGAMDVVRLLYARDADANAKDKEGRTPLKYALLGNRDAAAEFLRQHGAKE